MFPRGGSLRLTAPVDGGGASNEKNVSGGDGALFSMDGPTKKAKRAGVNINKKNKRQSSSEMDALEKQLFKRQKRRDAEDGQVGNLLPTAKTKSVFTLRRKALLSGSNTTLVLGVVTQCGSSSAQISLGGGLMGRVLVEDLSDEHKSDAEGCERSVKRYLSRGKVVVCAPINSNNNEDGPSVGNREVRVSLSASRINSTSLLGQLVEGSCVYGTIHSVEDHGYHVNLGHSVRPGFLRFSSEEADDEDIRLLVGSGVQLLVQAPSSGNGKKSKVLELLRATGTEVTKSVAKLEQVVPGMFVKGSVLRYVEDGAIVEFLGFLSGTVSRFHLKNWQTDLDELVRQQQQPTKNKMLLKVLFVDLENKRIGLSANFSVNQEKCCAIFDKVVGRTFTDAVVCRVDKGRGVLLQVPKSGGGEIDDNDDSSYHLAYARRSFKSEDDNNEEIVQVDDKFKVGQVTACRVLGYSPVDGMLNVSLAKSVIEASVLRFEDLVVGEKVRSTVIKTGDFGLLVALSDGVRGKVPTNHLSDVFISDIGARFKPGQVLDVRVLSLDLNSGDNQPKLLLSNKRSLVQSDLPRITHFDDAKPGMVTHGVVSGSSKSKGVFVTFFGNVSGRVDNADLLALGVDDPSGVYKIGSVIKVKVSGINHQRKQINLSVRPSTENSTSNVPDNGSVVSGKVVSKDSSKVVVKLENGSVASLPTAQLSDSSSLSKPKTLKKSHAVKDAVVLDSENGVLTLKPALLAAAANGALPSTLESMVVGSTVVGFVKNVSATVGVFVQFGGGLTALAPRANVTDGFVADPNDHFLKGETVLATVCEVNEETQRVVVSLKPSALDIPSFAFPYFLPTTKESKSVAVVIGQNVKAKVTKVTPHGVELDLLLDDTTTDEEDVEKKLAFCLKQHYKQKYNPEVGDNVNVRVLDTCGKLVDVTMRSSLVKAGSSKKAMQKTAAKLSSSSSSSLDAVVELVKPGYAIVSCSQCLCIAPTKSFNGPIYGLGGLEIDAHTKVTPTEHTNKDGVVVVQMASDSELDSTQQLRKRARSRGASMDLGKKTILKIGSIVRGKVRDIQGAWLNVALGPNVTVDEKSDHSHRRLHGQMHMSDLSPFAESPVISSPNTNCNVLDPYSVGDVVEARVVGMENKVDTKGRDIANIMLVPETNLEDDGIALEDLKVGQKYNGFVDHVVSDGVQIALSRRARGFVYCTQLSRDVNMLEKLFNKSETSMLPTGTRVTVTVLEIDKNHAQLSMIF